MRPLALVVGAVLWAAPARAQLPAVPDRGPCTQAAALGMPEGEDHDHNDPAQHQGLFCGIRQVSFLPLTGGELGDNPDSNVGEMDVKGNLAAVGVAEPVGGALFFDISDPSQPRFLSRIDDAACALGSYCGAYVELTRDAKYALLSVQQTDLMPGLITGHAGEFPGVALIDVQDPSHPQIVQEYVTLSVEGVHTARAFDIPDSPFAGEYAALILNGVGTEIVRLLDTPAGRRIVHVGVIPVPDALNITSTHDTFIQTDAIDGKIYLYAAGGFTYGFRVYDLANPASPQEVAAWDLTPQCANDWYAHTIDVAERNGRRYVTLDTELFDFGRQTDASEECGTFQGNSDKAGPLWIIDATDFSKLATPTDDVATIKAKSEAALVTAWTNPAGREAGQLTFSPHNQQIVGDKIYLSHYHGGIFVLDASAAFAGRHERPRELAWALPFDPRVRPTLDSGQFPLSRGDFWDLVFHRGYILAADIQGGVYSLQEIEAAPPSGEQPCVDRSAPRSVLTTLRIGRRGVMLRGASRDDGCGGQVERVLVAVALGAGRRCRFLDGRGRLRRPSACTRPRYVPARGTRSFSLRLKAALPRGNYLVSVRAIDLAGNIGRPLLRRVKVR